MHRSRPVQREHVYGMRVYSFYYYKWHHLVNRWSLDNAILKVQHHRVGWRLAHMGKKSVVFVEPGSKINSHYY